MSNSIPSRRHAGFSGTFGQTIVEITPPTGIYSRNWGAAKHDVADSIHRPLYLSVLTVGNGHDAPLVLVDADLGWWRPLSLFEDFRKRLLKETGIASENLIFALSHTHASAPLMKSNPDLPGSHMQDAWLEEIYQKTVNAIQTALAETFSGSLEWNTGSCHLAAQRDLQEPESDRFICGYNPHAEADSTLVVGRLTDDSGELRAVVANYACHPTTLAWENGSISPDYPGAYRATVQQAVQVNAFFLLGASGELAPRHQYVGDVEVADRHGQQLAYATLATLYDMEPPNTELTFTGVMESGAPLAVWKPQPCSVSTDLAVIQRTVDLDLKDWPTADELEQQRAECTDRALEERLRRKRDIRRALGDGKTFPVEFTAWKMGGAILIGSCCEAYSLLQRELRRKFPDRTIACMNLINGTIGYLPPQELYESNIYQVWQTPFAAGSLEKLIDAMEQTIQELVE